MLVEYYPMTPFRYVKPSKKYLATHCCCFDACFYDVEPRSEILWLSLNKAIEISPDHLEDNGKIVSASYIKVTLNELDYQNMCSCYSFSKVNVKNFMISKRGKLPRFIREEVAELYIDKNRLKDGDPVLYHNKKEYLNGTFGMMVTSLIQDNLAFIDGEVVKEEIESVAEALHKAQHNYSVFTLYQWGVWIIAHARRNLIKVSVCEETLGNTSWYSDTDSDKFSANARLRYVKWYNRQAKRRARQAFEELGFSPSASGDLGQMVKENKQPLLFKSLGAKRYLLRGDNKQRAVVSGCNVEGIPRYAKSIGIDMFDLFDIGMVIPPPYSGRTTSTYVDTEQNVCLKDKDGREWEGRVGSCLVVEDSCYTMDIGKDYRSYIGMLQHKGE